MVTRKRKADTSKVEVKMEQTAPGVSEQTAKVEKAPARKRVTASRKATEVRVSLYVQYQGRQISEEEVVETVKATWTGEPIETLSLYVKPEDGAVYYVVNGGEGGKVEF